MDIFNKVKELAKKAKNEKSEKIIQDEINRIREDAIVHAKELALFYDKQQKAMVNLLHKIRLEMKKFET